MSYEEKSVGNSSKKWPLALPILISGTLIWLVVLYLATEFALSCPASEVIAGHSLMPSSLRCLSANEFGDFLAGAFAPLAFWWLVGTVFIQARELAAQRQELALTRESVEAQRHELEQSRRVMEAQASYIGEQTQLLRIENEQRVQQEADREFQELLNSAFRELKWVSYFQLVQPVSEEQLDVEEFAVPLGGPFSDAPNLAIRELSYLAESWKKFDGNITVEFREDPFVRTAAPTSGLESLLEKLARIRSRISESAKIEWDSLRIEEALGAVKSVHTAAPAALISQRRYSPGVKL